MTKDETEGRIRAIEAILLHLPGIDPDVIHAAKDWIRNPERQSDSQLRYFAAASVLMSPPETPIATSPTSSLSLAYAELNRHLLQFQAVAPSRLFGPPWI